MVKDSVDVDEMSLEDLDGLFDDDGVDAHSTADALELGSGNASFELFEPVETPSAVEASVLSQVDSACASLAPISSEPRRRRSPLSRGADGKAPVADWHSEADDRTHRQIMIHEVARLLHSRKKTQPSAEWLKQLPHKARKLEERLYWSARNLADYLEMSTLKNRLQRVADTISKSYTQGKKTDRSSMSKSSISSSLSRRVSSSSSVATTDSSQGSIDSLRSLRNSFMQKSNMQQQQLQQPQQQQQQYQQLGHDQYQQLGHDQQQQHGHEEQPPQQQQLQQQQQQHQQPNQQQQQMELLELRQQQQQQQQLRQQYQHQHQQQAERQTSSNGASTQFGNSFRGSTMNALNSIPENRYLEVGGHLGNQSSSASGTGTSTNTNTFQQGTANTTTNTANNSASHAATGNTGSKSEGSLDLERQKAINANLQQQISENIKRQEELVRQMQERGQGPAPKAPPPSTASSAPGSGSMPDARAMQMAGQQMQGNHMYIQGNGMNSMAGAPYGTNFNAAQNGYNRQELGGVIQSSGGQYNLVNPVLGQQGAMGMESPLASPEHSAAVMSNSNQQLARILAANPTHQQLSRLLAANPSLYASMQQQQQHQFMVQPFGASSAPVGGYHPSMPPPYSNSMSRNSNSAPTSPSNPGDRGIRNGDDSLLPDSPLSPGSFHW